MKRTVLSGFGPEEVCSLFQKGGVGSVRMVTSAGVYLELDGRVALLCRESWGVVPIGVSMRSYTGLLALGPEAGQQISCREGILTFPGGEAELRLTMVKEKKKTGKINPTALGKLGEELACLEKKTGLAPLAGELLRKEDRKNWNLYCEKALPGLKRLLDGLENDRTEQVEVAVEELLGLGPGLTPSADDVLCGMLYVLLRSRASERDAVGALVRAVRREAPGRTNAVSAAYLAAIAGGGYYERMHDIWLGMTGCAPVRAERLLEVGSNSGSEMLLGMLAAGMLLCRMEENRYGRTHCTGSLG